MYNDNCTVFYRLWYFCFCLQRNFPFKNNDTIGEGKVSFPLSIIDDEGEQIDVTTTIDKSICR